MLKTLKAIVIGIWIVGCVGYTGLFLASARDVPPVQIVGTVG